MEISLKDVDSIQIMGIKGRIDAATSKEVETKLNDLIDQNQAKIIVDLEGVEYISSVGLRVLLAALKQQKKKQGCLMLTALQPFVREVFEVTGFTKLFSVYPNQAEAISACSSKAA